MASESIARPGRARAGGFTLIEMLVAMALMTLLMVLIFSVISQVGTAWRSLSSRVEAFHESRVAFETMTHALSQATLNTYYDYFDSNGNSPSSSSYNGTPSLYGRQSELQFVCGKALVPGQVTDAVFFQSPMGVAGTPYSSLTSLLNACGYFIQFGSDDSTTSLSGRASFLGTIGVPLRYRYRLMELSQPAEQLQIYNPAATSPTAWFSTTLAQTPPPTRVLVENAVALILLPERSPLAEAQAKANSLPPLSSDYEYNSRIAWTGASQPVNMNQLPSLVKVVLVTIDEASATRLQGSATTAPDVGLSGLFQAAANLNSDLKKLTDSLAGEHLNYRVFQTEVALRSSQWTEN